MNVIRKSTEIAKILRSQILSGKIISGKLPSERILSEQFQVARNTIRSALSVLEQADQASAEDRNCSEFSAGIFA